MHLEREEEEAHGGEEERVREKDDGGHALLLRCCLHHLSSLGLARLLAGGPADPDKPNHARQDDDEGGEEGDLGETSDAGELAELDDDVERAPDVGDLVLEEAAREGEDAMEGLEEMGGGSEEGGEKEGERADGDEAEVKEQRYAAKEAQDEPREAIWRSEEPTLVDR